MRLLIADDDPVSRDIIEMQVSGWGYEVVLAADGNEAWQILQSPDAPPLVILDWMMPGMTGVEVCQKVRNLQSELRPYIILLTGKEAEKNLVIGMRAGADAYVTKPVGPDELHVFVKEGERIIATQMELHTARERLRHQVEILRKELR